MTDGSTAASAQYFLLYLVHILFLTFPGCFGNDVSLLYNTQQDIVFWSNVRTFFLLSGRVYPIYICWYDWCISLNSVILSSVFSVSMLPLFSVLLCVFFCFLWYACALTHVFVFLPGDLKVYSLLLIFLVVAFLLSYFSARRRKPSSVGRSHILKGWALAPPFCLWILDILSSTWKMMIVLPWSQEFGVIKILNMPLRCCLRWPPTAKSDSTKGCCITSYQNLMWVYFP